MSVTAVSSTWLVVASEQRELARIQKQSCWVLVASGPGSRLVTEALREKRNVDGVVSVGFCGALDPSLAIGDIVVSGDMSGDRVRRGPSCAARFCPF